MDDPDGDDSSTSEEAEPTSVPGEHGVRFDEDERRLPTAPYL
jgi:hypothetical protein